MVFIFDVERMVLFLTWDSWGSSFDIWTELTYPAIPWTAPRLIRCCVPPSASPTRTTTSSTRICTPRSAAPSKLTPSAIHLFNREIILVFCVSYWLTGSHVPHTHIPISGGVRFMFRCFDKLFMARARGKCYFRSRKGILERMLWGIFFVF